QTAGSPILNQVTPTPVQAQVTAYDQYGNKKTDYNGAGTLAFKTNANGPDTGTATASLSWSGEVGTVTATAYRTGSQNLTVSDAGKPSATLDSGNFTVAPAAIDHFLWTTQ